MNGKITNYLKDLVCKQLYERGIVVWYDPQRAYKNLVQRFDLPETALLRYEEGFFRLRVQLESCLECVTEDGKLRPDADRPPRVVLYVPMDREESRYALIEAETAGGVMEPGAPRTECNTRLGLLAEKVFEKIAPAKAAHLARQADDRFWGRVTLNAHQSRDYAKKRAVFWP